MNAKGTVWRAWRVLLLAMAISLAGCAGLGLLDDTAALMQQGQTLYAEKKYDEAIDKFVEVATKDPKHWQAYLWAARAYIAKGKWFDAIANGRKAFELAPKDPAVLPVFAEALFGAGSAALASGRYAESVTHFLEFLKIEPGNARAWLNVGKAYLEQRQFKEALGALTQGLSQGGGAERAELLRGLLDGGRQAFAGGKNREAIDLLKEFIKYDKKDVSAYVNLAKAYWESGDLGSALETFQKVLKLDPRQEEALRFLLRR